jgi:peptide methionine sulfoxide reductase msrA/msrB
MDKSKTLTPDVLNIVRDKKTERPTTGIYNTFSGTGTYLCRQCGLALFRSDHKFLSGCGWPSFDDEIPNTIKRLPDSDGQRTEILCNRCQAHLGHIFEGEYLTVKNKRYCVNSAAIDFVNSKTVLDTEEAVFAGGCFWGMQHLFDKLPGAIKTEVGYSGGDTYNPQYEIVCQKKTGHLEVLRIIFDTALVNYETITKYFFEIHDPTQINGQGPDIGPQYLSAIFYFDEKQKDVAERLISILKEKSLQIATLLKPAAIFWPAEEYHQKYYDKTAQTPYCHVWRKLF